VSGIGGAILGLLTAVASCAGILQYIESTPPTQPSQPNPPAVVVITSEPASNYQTSLSTEDWQAVESFLTTAVVAEIAAYQYGDAAYATMFYGDALQSIQNEIMDLNSRGLLLDAQFDYENSYLDDIRLAQNRIEVDSCEYWANDYYNRETGEWLGSEPVTLVPQTITIEQLSGSFYITSISFHTGQAFCQ
jgi:hypothetical protein